MRSFFISFLLLGFVSSELLEVDDQLENDVKPWLSHPRYRLGKRSVPEEEKEENSWEEILNQLIDGLTDEEMEERLEIGSDVTTNIHQKRRLLRSWAKKVGKENEVERFLEKTSDWRETMLERLLPIKQKAESMRIVAKAIEDCAMAIEDEDATMLKIKNVLIRIGQSTPEVAEAFVSVFSEYLSFLQENDPKMLCRLEPVEVSLGDGQIRTVNRYICNFPDRA